MFGLFKKKVPDIEELLFQAADTIEYRVNEVLQTQAELSFGLKGVELDVREAPVFAVAMTCSVGDMLIDSSNGNKGAIIDGFMNKYFQKAANALGVPKRELTDIFILNCNSYQSLLDGCFSKDNPQGSHNLAVALFENAFNSESIPGKGIGPSLEMVIGGVFANMNDELKKNK